MAWDGIVLALANKQIDMIASGMSITEKRRKVVDFSDPTGKSPACSWCLPTPS